MATLLVSAFGPAAVASGAATKSAPRVGEEVPVTANDLRRTQAHNSGVFAVDPTDERFVVLASRLDRPDFSCTLHVSGDGGRTWLPADPVPNLPKGADKCYAPEVAIDADGTVYYLFVGLEGRGNEAMGAFLTRSDDRGRTWSRHRKVLGPFNFAVRMAIDRTMGSSGRLHLVWLHATADPGLGSLPNPPNPILSAYSDDGGRTFSKPVQVNDPDRQMVVAPALALGPGHVVHVLYYDLQGDVRDYHGLEGPTWEGEWALLLATSTDGGRRFERKAVVVDERVVPPERVMLIFTMPPPSLAADRSGGVFAAWHDARNGDWDAFIRRSTDGGRTWAGARRLNDDPVGNGRHQYQPRLAVSPGGRLDAVFYDRREDPRNIRNDVFATSSTDGGRTFSANVKLTTRSSDTTSGDRYVGPAAKGLVEFGSRMALVSFEGRALAAWTDTRNALFSPHQDIFANELVFNEPSSSSGIGTTVVGGALGAGAVIAAAVGLRRRRRRLATRRADERQRDAARAPA